MHAVSGVGDKEHFSAVVAGRAAATPSAHAVVSPLGTLTYAELLARAQRVGGHLRTHGLAVGDRVLLVFRNHPSFVEAYLGCSLAGLVPVPCHPGLGWEGAARVAQAAGARAVLADGSEETRASAERSVQGGVVVRFPWDGSAPALDAGTLPPLPAEALPPLALLVSSGSSGAPKLIARSHRGFGGASRRFGELWGARPGARFAAGSMITHAAALGWGVQAALMAGATLIVPVDRRPAPLLEALGKLEAETVFLVPTQGRALLNAVTEDPSLRPLSLRRIIFGGERLEPALAHGLVERLGVQIQNTYGMTEGFCTSTDPTSLNEIDAESVGTPCFLEDALRVLDEHGAPVRDGEPGELWVRGASLADGYWGLPSDPRFSPDGFFRTGDRVRLEGRRVFYVGRLSALINRGGLKLSPEYLEQHLSHHPRVEQVVAVGVRDEQLGERVCALVRPHPPPPTREELTRFLDARGVGKAYHPDRVHSVDALPLNAVGKVDRRAATLLAMELDPELQSPKPKGAAPT